MTSIDRKQLKRNKMTKSRGREKIREKQKIIIVDKIEAGESMTKIIISFFKMFIFTNSVL